MRALISLFDFWQLVIELPIANNWVQSFGNNDDQIAGKKGSAHTGMIRHDDAEENNSFPVFFMVRSSRSSKRWY